MAIEDFKEGKEGAFGVAEETTFLTALADSVDFTEIATEAAPVDPDAKREEVPGAHQTKQPTLQDILNHTKGSMPTVTIKGPASIYEMDNYLYMFTQKVIDVVASPMTKTFTPHATQPDFSVSAGMFMTAIKRFPVASTSVKLTSCVVNSIKLSIERDGFLQNEASLISPVAPDFTSNPSGTWERGLDGPGGSDAKATNYGMLHFNDIDSAVIKLNGGGDLAVTLETFEMNLAYEEVKGVSPDGAGGWQTLGFKGISGDFSIGLLKDSTVESAIANRDANGDIEFILNFGATGAAVLGELQLTMFGKIDGAIEIDEEGLIGANIKATMMADTSATDMFEIILSNGILRGWPAA